MPEVIVDYNKLESAAANLDKEIKHLKELFDKQSSNFQLLDNNKMWYGTSCKNCLNKYNEVKGKYGEIINNLNSYKDFLLNVSEAYKSFNTEAVKSIDAIG